MRAVPFKPSRVRARVAIVSSFAAEITRRLFPIQLAAESRARDPHFRIFDYSLLFSPEEMMNPIISLS